MIEALGWGALAASSLVLGAFLALVRTWSDTVVGLVLGFGAGALIASVSFELAEEGLRVGGAWPVALRARASAALTFYFANRWVEVALGRHGRCRRRAPWRSGAFLDGIPEQAVLGIGLAPGAGRQRRAARRDLRLQPARRRSAPPPTCGRRGVSKGQVLGLWTAVAAACALATVGRLPRRRRGVEQP